MVHPPTPPWLPIGHSHGHDRLTALSFHVTFKLQGQGHGCGQRARSYSQPGISLICFLFVSHQSDNSSLDIAILKFDLEKSKVNVMGEVKGQGHIIHPTSNRCTSFSLHINRTNRS